MREKERIERILKKIQKLWEAHQDYRFYQMLINFGIMPDSQMWHISDKEVEEHIDKKVKEYFDGKSM